jgi:hypothetical protein
VPENHQNLSTFLTKLGLAFSLRSNEYATNAVIALEQLLIDQFIQAQDAATVGRLIGYPQTAEEAFDADTLMDTDEQDALMESYGLSLFMPQFRFSQLHAKDEIKVLQDWHQTLGEYSFL